MTPPPKFVPFELERWQSTWENRVRFNLSESGLPAADAEDVGIGVELVAALASSRARRSDATFACDP